VGSHRPHWDSGPCSLGIRRQGSYGWLRRPKAWGKADVEIRKRIIRLLGMRITINRVGPGNGREYDPDSVSITW
jgi:hypothetical protein